MFGDEIDFSTLQGMTMCKVTANSELSEIRFVNEVGEIYKLFHEQDCSECVTIESIAGDLTDLIGSPLLLAEEVCNSDSIDKDAEGSESFTWTFYKLATIKGYVDIRWLGVSNGYYSEAVSLVKLKEIDVDYLEYTKTVKAWVNDN